MTAYLGLGTNLGEDKAANLRQAVDMLHEQAGHVFACSTFIESEPWGFQSTNTFLNAVIAIETTYTPHQLLAITQSIERAMGRTHKSTNGNYTDRIIDIDILLYDDIIIDTPELTIPHPLILQREFVYRPLLEIAPQLRSSLGFISSLAERDFGIDLSSRDEENSGLFISNEDRLHSLSIASKLTCARWHYPCEN